MGKEGDEHLQIKRTRAKQKKIGWADGCLVVKKLDILLYHGVFFFHSAGYLGKNSVTMDQGHLKTEAPKKTCLQKLKPGNCCCCPKNKRKLI